MLRANLRKQREPGPALEQVYRQRRPPDPLLAKTAHPEEARIVAVAIVFVSRLSERKR
jgi:hypothetical protein